MEDNKEALRKAGLGVCAISYDNREVLRDFAKRKGITVPLLSDPHSDIIRAFGIFNNTIPPDQLAYGVPFPGSFLVDQNGVVLAKYFEDDYRDRYSVGTILTRQFNSRLGTRETSVQLDQLSITSYASSDIAASGARITLVLDIKMKDNVHLYAPGVKGYVPVQWDLTPSPGLVIHPMTYPTAKTLYLPAIREKVPVYTKNLRLVRDVTVSPDPRALPSALNSANELVIKGVLQLQACDDKICFLPQKTPLQWTIQIDELDKQRVPEKLQRNAQPIQ